MAKPSNRTKASNRPSYKKILKQQEQQELKGESQEAIDQIAALEALLGGGLLSAEPEVVETQIEEPKEAELSISPEEQQRLDEERTAREEERTKERSAREEERRKLQQELVKQQEDRETRYKEEQEKLKVELLDKKDIKKQIAEGKKELKRLHNLNKIGKLNAAQIKRMDELV
ncbi:MAG: hypothetical protein ACJA1X_002104, partial [Bermanella sp.]